MPSVIMPSVIIPSVIIPNVLAPIRNCQTGKGFPLFEEKKYFLIGKLIDLIRKNRFQFVNVLQKDILIDFE
jgi:hypothetical protein